MMASKLIENYIVRIVEFGYELKMTKPINLTLSKVRLKNVWIS
jgi:hypothetical protein